MAARRHRGRRLISSRGVVLGAAALLIAIAPVASAELAGARLEELSFAGLSDWERDDHAAALNVFRRTCAAVLADRPELRPAPATADDLRPACKTAVEIGKDPVSARGFFEEHFTPVAVIPPSGAGFLTGYFEPEIEGSLTQSESFPTPLLSRPDNLVTFAPGEVPPGLDPSLAAARRTPAGFEPYPDRAAIEDGALGDHVRPVAFVRDPVEAFIVHVQGSARLRLPGGGAARIAYAGRNGHPYTSIGRIIVAQGHVPLAQLTLERLKSWLRENPDEGRAIMRQNRSYIFFRRADEIASEDGPIGATGVPLSPGRSLAVDQALWSYGLPVWLEGAMPLPTGEEQPLRRLMIAQDTGTAIVGPARGDFFVGSGPEAGTQAGLLRHPVRFVVLRPRPPAP